MKVSLNNTCHGRKNRYLIPTTHLLRCRGKHNVTEGSLTVEASFAFPIFIYAVMMLLYFFLVARAQYILQTVISDTAHDVSTYGVIIEKLYGKSKEAVTGLKEKAGITGSLINSLGLERYVTGLAEDKLISILVGEKLADEAAERKRTVNSVVKNGIGGLRFAGSRLVTDDNCIDIVCSYTIAPPVSFFSLGEAEIIQRVKFRHFTGTIAESLYIEAEEEESETEETTEEVYVYITTTGTVYHIIHNCPSLNIKPKAVDYDRVTALRNSSGGKYYECERCTSGKKRDGTTVYVTSDGNRYHISLGCSGLKRTIEKVPLSQASGKGECQRCRKSTQ